MDLNINSPMYYTDEYGVDDEIYWTCRELAKWVKDKKYSNYVNIVGIVPIIAPKDIIEKGVCKEHKKCEAKYGFASVSLQINYEEYVAGDISVKKSMIIKNVLESVKAVSKRGKIDYNVFESDVTEFCKNNSIII